MIDIEKITSLPPAVLLVVVLNALAVLVRKLPCVSNWVIPWIVVGVGTVIYPRISTPANTVFSSVDVWTLYCQGFGLGFMSLGLDSLLAKFDWYKRSTGSFGDAYTQGKSDDAPKSELKDQPRG
jgi:hypothetical protein